MLNLRIYRAKVAKSIISITILTHFLFYAEISSQKIPDLTSPLRSCWKFETDKMTPTNLASDNEENISSSISLSDKKNEQSKQNKQNIYLSLLGGKLESINFKTGKKSWESELGGEIILTPIIYKESIYVTSKIKEKIYIRSLSRNSGVTNWQASFNFSNNIFLLKAVDKLIILDKDGEISAINPDNGAVLWNNKSKIAFSTPPFVFENQIVVGNIDKKVLFYSIENGSILAKLNVSTIPSLTSIINNRYLFWSNYKGNAYLIDLIPKKTIWKFRSGAEISHITVTGQGILISSLDNFIYFVSVDKGKLLWKKRFDGRLLFNPVIIDKYAIVITSSSNLADIIDIESSKIINQIVIEENNYFTNMPLISDNLFVFPTINGLIAFTNSKVECISN